MQTFIMLDFGQWCFIALGFGFQTHVTPTYRNDVMACLPLCILCIHICIIKHWQFFFELWRTVLPFTSCFAPLRLRCPTHKRAAVTSFKIHGYTETLKAEQGEGEARMIAESIFNQNKILTFYCVKSITFVLTVNRNTNILVIWLYVRYMWWNNRKTAWLTWWIC